MSRLRTWVFRVLEATNNFVNRCEEASTRRIEGICRPVVHRLLGRLSAGAGQRILVNYASLKQRVNGAGSWSAVARGWRGRDTALTFENASSRSFPFVHLFGLVQQIQPRLGRLSNRSRHPFDPEQFTIKTRRRAGPFGGFKEIRQEKIRVPEGRLAFNQGL